MPQDYEEEDFKPVAAPSAATSSLPGTAVEIVRAPPRHEPPRHVLFDFDGTLSLIREGWPDVMIPMMVEASRRPARTSRPRRCGPCAASSSRS